VDNQKLKGLNDAAEWCLGFERRCILVLPRESLCRFLKLCCTGLDVGAGAGWSRCGGAGVICIQ